MSKFYCSISSKACRETSHHAPGHQPYEHEFFHVFLLFYTVFCKQDPTVIQLVVNSKTIESEAASVQESEVGNHSPVLNQDAGRQTAAD